MIAAMHTTHGVTHYRPDTCYGCRLKSLSFATGQPQTHRKKGDPWRDNPVAERIDELRAQGRRVAAMELTNPAAKENP